MKLLRIMLATFLVVGMLLGASSIAYAEEPQDPPPDPPQGDPPPPDPSIQVDILVEGENPEVNVGVAGDNPDLNIGIGGDNPNVNINGQNLNEPTAVYNVTYGGGGGVDGSWVKKKIGQAVNPLYSWMDEYGAKMELAANGLAKVIFLAQDNESKVETQISLTDEYGNRLTELESDSAYLGKRVKTLEAQDEVIKAYVVARDNYLRAYYSRILVTIVVLFSVIVLGLAAGLGVLWRRIRV